MNNILLKSVRLTFRACTAKDVKDIHALLMREESVRYNPSGYPVNIEATGKMVRSWMTQSEQASREQFTFYLETTADKEFIGLISLGIIKPKYRNAEVWFKLKPDYWGKGYATEALKQLLKFGFEQLDLHRIEGGCAIDNIASSKVMEKAGLIREAHRRKSLPLMSGWSDNYEYAILEEDYFK